jgi:hypothetical protein
MRAIYLSRFFFAFLSSYGSFSCVSFSDSFTFSPFSPYSPYQHPQKFIFSRATTRENLSFSLSLSLFSYFVLEKGREHRHRFFEGDDDDGFAGLSLLLRGTAKHR